MASGKPHQERDPKAISEANGVITIKPRGLNIVWGKDPRYWKVAEQDAEQAAELLQVCWLEVTGSAQIDPKKDYKVSFDLSLTPDAFGWRGCPVYLMVKIGNQGKFASKKYDLTTFDPNSIQITCISKSPGSTNRDPTLYFGLYEVWSGKWKGGLKINHVTIQAHLSESNT